MKIKSKRVIRMVVCILLSTMVLACSFSALAYDLGDRVNGYEYLWCYYIYQFLHSIGIDVTYNGLLEYTQEVQETIIDWVVNYIADLIEADSQPSNYSISQWVAPWQAEYDYWGNLKFNSTMLEDMQDFAEWLKQELSLVDNDNVVINPTYTYGSYNLYRTNTWYSATPYGNATPSLGDYGMFRVETVGDFLWMPVILTNGIGYIFFDDSSFSSVRFGNLTSDDTVNNNTSTTFYCSSFGVNQDGWYYGANEYTINSNASWLPTGGNYYNSDSTWQNWRLDSSDIMRYIQVSHIVEDGDVAVITTLIVLPDENPDYVSGDGMIIVDGVPQYEPVVIDNVSVDNLPAVIQPQNVENPEIEQFYDFIPSFIEEAGDSMNFFKQIIFRMPDEVLYCIYSVLAAGVIFGFLRILREH